MASWLMGGRITVILLSLILVSHQESPKHSPYEKFRAPAPCQLDGVKTAIRNVRVFDGHSMSEPQTVIIDGCSIGQDPSSAEPFDASGMFLLPGFIESHSHPANATHLERAGAQGITTVMSLACQPISECLALADLPGLPDIHTAGQPALTPGSIPASFPGMNPSLFVSDIDDVPGFVSQTVDSGAEYVKIIAGPPDPLSEEAIHSIVTEATARGFRSVAHVTTRDSYLQSLRAGVSMTHHIAMDSVIDKSDIEQFLGRAACPTLSMMKALSSPNAHLPGVYNYSNAQENIKVFLKAGVAILAGTDASPSMMPALPDIMDGSIFHAELELLTEAGMSALEVIRAATVVPAGAWGFQDRGEIRSGMRADLVLLRENPLDDIRATRSVERVWFRGQASSASTEDSSMQHDEL